MHDGITWRTCACRGHTSGKHGTAGCTRGTHGLHTPPVPLVPLPEAPPDVLPLVLSLGLPEVPPDVLPVSTDVPLLLSVVAEPSPPVVDEDGPEPTSITGTLQAGPQGWWGITTGARRHNMAHMCMQRPHKRQTRHRRVHAGHSWATHTASAAGAAARGTTGCTAARTVAGAARGTTRCTACIHGRTTATVSSS